MKNLVVVLIAFLGFYGVQAQDKMRKHSDEMTQEIAHVQLDQIKGEFVQKQITLKPGTYIFDVSNKNVGHEVGFVLVKKGADISNPKNHIQTAYVTQAVKTGETQQSNPTKLEAGEYVYFCPLNPTSTDNTILVE
ncbi:plastocyanin/azurin family copper-binding protein [Nonlabens sp. MIC269]|uniref:plastocyanin/azurin family copper-binding protein n=1 Tax=Nonlabens sp. MIC269 TaxID=1476901 RepID=UPI000A60048C|nr:plastocyanin/azurin family copper-binding protein [Nonlabens sp. MIC269]